jgi:Protein of unknown function (DUF3500)
MSEPTRRCPDCNADMADRRRFLKSVAATAAATTLPIWATPRAAAAPTPTTAAETAVKGLFDSLTPDQKSKVCFAWDHKDPKRGLLRTFVSNNWHIVPQTIRGDFYTQKQQHLIHDIYKALLNPKWLEKFDRQTREDNGGKPWGTFQNIAIFGEPGTDKFELVLTGRHMTLRADGNTGQHVAFGGPIFYGHAGQGFNEKKDHPGNVFWPQALAANKVYQMLDGKQRAKALVAERPAEDDVGFRGGKGGFHGLAVGEMSSDQKAELQKVLGMLVEPFRVEDRDEALACLKSQGGLDRCMLSFYEDGDIGEDKVWDNWRLEGPAFVWYFRGEPHVHVWVNIADDPSVPLNAKG